MKDSTEVLIVGGGPAGSTAAALLAAAGRSVTVIEKERFPRFHIGESLLPYSAPLFRRLGVWDRLQNQGFQRKLGAQFIFEPGQRASRLDFQKSLDRDLSLAFQVRRAELDQLLLDNARDQGAEALEGLSVDRVLFEESRAVGAEVRDAEGNLRVLRAKVVIDATGRDTLLGRQLGLKRKDEALRQAALFGHFKGAEMGLGPEGGDILVVGGEYGWFWLIPLDQDTTSVGVVFPSRVLRAARSVEQGSSQAVFDLLVAQSPEVSKRLRNARCSRPVEAAADFSYRCKQFVGDGWMLVGDAAGFLDPVFSSGVFLAMSTAARAADLLVKRLRAGGPVRRKDLIGYERFAARGFDRFRRYILAYYDPACVSMFAREPPVIIRRAVSSAFAGKVFARDPRIWLMESLFFGGAARLRRLAARNKVELPLAPSCE